MWFRMANALKKSDLVGETIREVWETRNPAVSNDGGVVAVRVFVELANGHLLEMTYNDLSELAGEMAWSNVSKDDLRPATVVDWTKDWRRAIIGTRVVEIIC